MRPGYCPCLAMLYMWKFQDVLESNIMINGIGITNILLTRAVAIVLARATDIYRRIR